MVKKFKSKLKLQINTATSHKNRCARNSDASLSGNNEDWDELNILGEVDGHLYGLLSRL